MDVSLLARGWRVLSAIVCITAYCLGFSTVVTAQQTPQPQQTRQTPAPKGQPLGDLHISGALSQQGPAVQYDVVWRVFAAIPDVGGSPRLIDSATGRTAHFRLPPGDYVVHGAYGQVSASRRITLTRQGQQLAMIFNAGALSLSAIVGDNAAIDDSNIRYELYAFSADNTHLPVQDDVQQNKAVPLPPGRYHVVSTYGQANAVVRFDVTVKRGLLTQITVRHKAARISLRLVRNAGGEALANTTWTLLTPGGDVVRQTTGAYLDVVLAQGSYSVVAQHNGGEYTRRFNVKNGENRNIDLLME